MIRTFSEEQNSRKSNRMHRKFEKNCVRNNLNLRASRKKFGLKMFEMKRKRRRRMRFRLLNAGLRNGLKKRSLISSAESITQLIRDPVSVALPTPWTLVSIGLATQSRSYSNTSGDLIRLGRSAEAFWLKKNLEEEASNRGTTISWSEMTQDQPKSCLN